MWSFLRILSLSFFILETALTKPYVHGDLLVEERQLLYDRQFKVSGFNVLFLSKVSSTAHPNSKSLAQCL
jgi:hypothetical protein